METTPQKLHKASGEAGIRQYFEAIVRLEREQKEQFPIDLDTVWELAYNRRDEAVRSLTGTFTEGTDYQQTRKKAGLNIDGRGVKDTIKYFLTVPAMEWFVARRVPAVFAVYREVFHQSVKKVLPSVHDQYLTGLIGSPLVVNNTSYWPYNFIMVGAGYKRCPHRLYQLANKHINDVSRMFGANEPMFIREYGRVWARAEVFTYLAKRRDAWVALNEAGKEFNLLLS